MKISTLNTRGFVHYFLLTVVVMAALIGSVFVLVLKAHNHTAANHAVTSHTNVQNTLSTNAQSQPGVTAINVPAPSTSSSKPANSSSATSNSTGTKSSGSLPTHSGPTTVPPSSPTPHSVLTTLVTNLENGISANVTAHNVSVPAAVSGTVSARPLVFSVSGTTYYAFTRVNPPNFNTSVSATVDSMAVVVASGKPALTQAYLDKSSNLIDSYFELVGYTPSNY